MLRRHGKVRYPQFENDLSLNIINMQRLSQSITMILYTPVSVGVICKVNKGFS